LQSLLLFPLQLMLQLLLWSLLRTMSHNGLRLMLRSLPKFQLLLLLRRRDLMWSLLRSL
jgi:hypothetical protein